MTTHPKHPNHVRRVSAWIRTFAIALMLTPTLPVFAVDYCVSTAVELQSALNQAALDTTGNDSVGIEPGTYSTADNGNRPFSYSSTIAHDLYILGGAEAELVCPSSSGKTILDGAGISVVLKTNSAQGTVFLYDLIIQNGFIAFNGDEIAAGLQMNSTPGNKGSVFVRDCIIRHNADNDTAGALGGFYLYTGNGGYIDFVNNLVLGNSSDNGDGAGVIQTDNSAMVYVANNTIVSNTTAGSGQTGGMVFAGAAGTSTGSLIADNIFWNNTTYGLALFDPVLLIDNDYGALGGNSAPAAGSTGNVSVNPQFADGANGNFRLSAASPLIGAGNAGDLFFFDPDLDGNAVAHGGKIDLGAYQRTIFSDGFGD